MDALALPTLVAQNLAGLVVVGPMMIEVYDELNRGRNLTFREAWRAMWRKFPHLIKSVGLLLLLIFGSASVQATNVVSSLLYMVTVPLSFLGLTLLYRNRELTPPLFQRLRRLVGRVRGRAAEGAPASPA